MTTDLPLTSRRRVGARGAWLEVDGVRIAYDEVGEGSPIVCLHALGHGARDFEPLMDALYHRYRVIALDWPGQGASAADTHPASVARYADLLARFLAQKKIERPILVGNSIGGAAAIEVAARLGDGVRALVVSNPAGLHERGWMARLGIRVMTRFFRAGARGAWWFPAIFAAYYRFVLPRAPAREQRRRIVDGAAEIAEVGEEAWSSFGEASSDLRERVRDIRCPVLVAWAARDRFNPYWMNRAAVVTFPQAEIHMFAAGHTPFLETPEELLKVFDGFAARHGLEAGR